MIRDYQAIQYTWFLRGKQRMIPTYGKHHGVKLIGVLNYETGKVHVVEEERYNAEAFLRFLQCVLEQYPSGKIVLVLDNARIHHAKLIQPFLGEHKDRLELVFLPPYSPEMNLIEGLWKWLKGSVIYNVFHSSIKEIRKHVQAFIASINHTPEEVIDRLCIKM
jgi:transposase